MSKIHLPMTLMHIIPVPYQLESYNLHTYYIIPRPGMASVPGVFVEAYCTAETDAGLVWTWDTYPLLHLYLILYYYLSTYLPLTTLPPRNPPT